MDRGAWEQTPGLGDGQGSLACCSSRGHKESDMTKRVSNSNNCAGHCLGDHFGARSNRVTKGPDDGTGFHRRTNRMLAVTREGKCSAQQSGLQGGRGTVLGARGARVGCPHFG